MYRSKLGLIFTIPLIILTLFSLFLVIDIKDTGGIWIILFTLLSILFIYYSTYYKLEGNILIIKSMLIINEKIDIKSISRIAETNDILSAPALSLDRLKIYYGDKKWIMVSPKNKNGFIEAIRAINPDIEIKRKRA